VVDHERIVRGDHDRGTPLAREAGEQRGDAEGVCLVEP
jgi:hypothetical protein